MGDKCSHSHSDQSHGKSHGGHSHGGHSHGHSHGGASGRVGVAFFLNLIFAIIELVGGLMTNSMAILSDALHDFGDALAIGFAWWMERKSHQKGNSRFTYGYRRLSVVSAFLTGVILVSGSIWIIANSIPRLLNPQPVHAEGMLGLAFLGIVVNGLAFFRLSGGSSLHERVLRWHFIEDLMGWILVLIGAVVMMTVGWTWIDPLLALCLSFWVMWNVLKHLRETISVFLQVSPDHLREGEAENWMRTLEGVKDVHHSHIWSLDGEAHILTAHVVLDGEKTMHQMSELKSKIKKGLSENFSIFEATIEFETLQEGCEDPTHA